MRSFEEGWGRAPEVGKRENLSSVQGTHLFCTLFKRILLNYSFPFLYILSKKKMACGNNSYVESEFCKYR